MRATICFLSALLLTGAAVVPARAGDTRSYELRTYYAAPGKLEALQARFRNHTCKLFEKHGMVNLGYWVPLENPDNKLIYLLSFPDRAARDQAFKAFGDDPEWKKVVTESEKEGKLVLKAESLLLQATDYSPEIKSEVSATPRIFELRVYTTHPGRRDALNQRFREHTVKLFQKHGMTNIGYWTPMPGQKDAEVTLVYLLAHSSKVTAEKSFAAFREDPAWREARAASEKDGPITIQGGVKSVFLQPTDFSQLK